MSIRRRIAYALTRDREVYWNDRMAAYEARIASLEAQVNALSQAPAHAPQEDQIAKLDKRLGMAMGAIQAATTQLMQLKSDTQRALREAHQANQRAHSALSTAESVADGLESLEGTLQS